MLQRFVGVGKSTTFRYHQAPVLSHCKAIRLLILVHIWCFRLVHEEMVSSIDNGPGSAKRNQTEHKSNQNIFQGEISNCRRSNSFIVIFLAAAPACSKIKLLISLPPSSTWSLTAAWSVLRDIGLLGIVKLNCVVR